jgi:D-serine deaminase-like pyridoxal phosphate-dependent protein
VPTERYPVGTLLRILPNHACATAAQHDRYHVMSGGTEIVKTWPRVNGWS